MNNCVFIGKIVLGPDKYVDNNITVATFNLSVEDYRKDKNGNKKTEVDELMFEAWHTGAEAILKNCKVGDTLAVEAVARVDDDGTTYFRVKNFKVFK